MLTPQQKNQAFEIFRNNPFVAWREVAKKIGVSIPMFNLFMHNDKDFKVAVESLKDIKEGKVGA